MLCLEGTRNVWRETCNVWRETRNFWRETCNVWRETRNVWRETGNIWRETCNIWRETRNILRETRNIWRETSNIWRQFSRQTSFRPRCVALLKYFTEMCFDGLDMWHETSSEESRQWLYTAAVWRIRSCDSSRLISVQKILFVLNQKEIGIEWGRPEWRACDELDYDVVGVGC